VAITQFVLIICWSQAR